MAYQQGDPTAKYAGRLTLNPLVHIDWWGTVLMPLMLLYFFRFFFGYAKPVPINPNNFRNQRKGLIFVSLAGVAANFIIAIILGLVVRYAGNFQAAPFLSFIVLVNIWLGLFNLLPVPPLDGSKLLFGLISGRSRRSLDFLEGAGSIWGIILALFIAVTFLPYVSQLLFNLITGASAGI
ncbi:MAG: site-2 protease family protein, partial [Candidatus Portnoybacteria bacterium]|nr:site-2 protease family protein [Candidatus Portnoybacteria bacterium]